jgi:hypothetical protein
MNTKIVISITLAVSLGGCTYVHSYLADSKIAEAKSFCEEQRADPAVRSIVGKLPLVSPDEITPDMMALQTVPADSELDAIKALAHDQHACRQRLRAVTQEYQPTRAATHDELNMKLDVVTAELLQKKMSYGNANRLYRQAALEASNKLTEQAKEELADAEEREAATWRSLGQTLVGAAKPPAPKADRSCSWVDSSVDCKAH